MIEVLIPTQSDFQLYESSIKFLYKQNQEKICDTNSFEFIRDNTLFYLFLLDKKPIGAIYYFKEKMIQKCSEFFIKLRFAERYFSSSKTCSNCGSKNKSLKLSDRIFKCEKCGFEIDRDENASINLLNLKDKKCLVLNFA